MQSASASAMGLPSSPTRASWMLAFLIPADVSRSLMQPPSRGRVWCVPETRQGRETHRRDKEDDVRSLAAVVVGVLGVGAYGALAGPAAAAASPKPVVVSVSASPVGLTENGGSIRVTARVRNATTCTFRHGPSTSAPLHKDAVVGCSSGRASATIRFAANTSTQALRLLVDVQAARNGKTAHKGVSVVEAGAPPPLAVASSTLNSTAVGSPYSAALAATGGRPPYTWTVTSGVLPSGLTLAAAGTITGTPTSSGRFPVTVQVADSAGQTATASLSLAVTPPLLPVGALALSSNWSGYALQGSSFTFAMGTFTVPNNTSS